MLTSRSRLSRANDAERCELTSEKAVPKVARSDKSDKEVQEGAATNGDGTLSNAKSASLEAK